jgi:hypothetical protein
MKQIKSLTGNASVKKNVNDSDKEKNILNSWYDAMIAVAL